MKTIYIYLSNKEFDGSVFQTQIIDWLKLYESCNINFLLFQFKHPRNILKFKQNESFSKVVENLYPNYRGYILHFPNIFIFYFLNSLLLVFKLRKFLFSKDRILIFGRVLIGNEIKILKFFFGKKIEFIFDARAASAEEIKYVAQKKNRFNKSKQNLFNRVKKLEKTTIHNSYRSFCVSKGLISYFKENYGFNDEKFFLYPCLADPNKFYYSGDIRAKTRKELNLISGQKLFIYSGGFSAEWHLNIQILSFFAKLSSFSKDYKFLILTKDIDNAKKIITENQLNLDNFKFKSVANDEVVKYLNAADYGILFRDITPMNMVASPSKFPEYMLCGLPTLITDKVGDFSEEIKKTGFGFIVNENLDVAKILVDSINNTVFDRDLIAKYGKENYSKSCILEEITLIFNGSSVSKLLS